MENLDTDISVQRVKKKKNKSEFPRYQYKKKQDTDHSEAPEVILS